MSEKIDKEYFKLGLWLEKKYRTKAVNELVSLHDMMEFNCGFTDKHVWDWKVNHIKGCWHDAKCYLLDHCDKEIEPIGKWIEKRAKSQLSDEDYKLIVNMVNIRLEEDLF